MTESRHDPGRRVAVITGGAGGMGVAIARALATQGYSLALVDLSAAGLARVAAEPAFAGVDVASINGDVSDASGCEAAINRVLEAHGRVDLLVNNAGIGFSSPLANLSVADIDNVLAVNLRGPILLSRMVVPHMVERGSGSIINIASDVAKVGATNIAPYSATKAGLLGFTRALAMELANDGIRVNAVCPGKTNTAMMANNIHQTAAEQGITLDEARAQWLSNVPTGVMVEPEDVANAVVFLASDRSRMTTGEALNVSAGVVTW